MTAEPRRRGMAKNRVEAFSDGVIAIIITIMVLELKVPHGSSWEVLAGVAPNFVSYVLSFVYLAIYWNNHHHHGARDEGTARLGAGSALAVGTGFRKLCAELRVRGYLLE